MLSKLKKAQLQEEASKLGLDTTGKTRAQIILLIQQCIEKASQPKPVFNVKHLDGFIYPEIDETFIISNDKRSLFYSLVKLSQTTGVPPNVLLTGAQGCGKTETVSQFAAGLGLPVLKINCSLVREARDWFGYKTAEAGTVSWVKSQFSEAVEAGNVVILMDEITRATPVVLNSLFPLLDHNRQSFIEEIKELLKVGPNVFFFATANIGAKFTGTYGRIDSALADRFAVRINVDYLSAKEETELLCSRTGIDPDTAGKLVTIANTIRSKNQTGGTLTETISTRTLLDAATFYKLMGKDSFEFTIVSQFSKEGGANSEQAQVLQTIQGQFP